MCTGSVYNFCFQGTIVNKNVGKKSVTVRFHGYNNEEEVSVIPD